MIHRRIPRRFADDRSGATAVEVALVTPVLAILLFGLFELGLAFHSGAAVRNAVQRASRNLLIDPATSADTLRATVLETLPGVEVQNLAITVQAETQSGVPVRRVSWTYGYPIVAPFVPRQTFVFDSSLVVPVPLG